MNGTDDLKDSPLNALSPTVSRRVLLVGGASAAATGGRLKILDTRSRRLGLSRSREGQSFDAWVEWDWIHDFPRNGDRPSHRKVCYAFGIFTLDARPRARQPLREGQRHWLPE